MMIRWIALAIMISVPTCVRAEWIWVEGEKPIGSTMNRHPWWYDQVKKNQLSGGDWISNFDQKMPGEAEYAVTARDGGLYHFWVHANPTLSKMSFRINDGEWKAIDFEKSSRAATNIAADDKPDLRFIAWVDVGKVELKRGKNGIRFRLDGEHSHHGGLDCFVLSTDPFTPRGLLKPGEIAQPAVSQEQGWFAFDPSADLFRSSSLIDLRSLNERVAGEHGWITTQQGQFRLGAEGQPVRFWGVNGVASKTRDDLKREARQLAKYGVNLVRLHGPVFDKQGRVDPAQIQRAFDVVETMKAEGIYTHFSIYFPLWFDPPADLEWMPGYDGKSHAFATLYFNEKFQQRYRDWWTALLTTPSPTTGKPLIDEPAVFGAELVNEDSLFFWTFNEQSVPGPQLAEFESLFGKWAKARHGSLEQALNAWNRQLVARDNLGAGRLGFRPLWNIANERTPRDQDTAEFLEQTQRQFYDSSTRYLRRLGFKGLITASNWVTANPEVLGPLEKHSYLSGDFVDRHGYFGCQNGGDAAEWSLREGHTYAERSALKFENEEPGKPAAFVHPAMDPHYNDKPSMISETTWNRPNRHRGEAPLYYAVYGALQGSDAIVHFAKDGFEWSAKPGYFMQPWTLTAPTQFGQFPAAAFIYRKGLIDAGEVMCQIALSLNELQHLQGTPLPQDAAFDELRLKDVPTGSTLQHGQRIDPLIHYVGQTRVTFSEGKKRPPPAKLQPLSHWIDHQAKTVTSCHGQLKLDWGHGLLTLNAPAAQGASGNLNDSGSIQLADITITVPRDVAHVVLISQDGMPLAKSKKMLLQVMTEEKASGFRAEALDERRRKIVAIGESPWLVRQIEGRLTLKRADAAKLNVIALDQFGEPTTDTQTAEAITLQPNVVYYSIQSP